MPADLYGLPVTTPSAPALEAYNRAVDALHGIHAFAQRDWARAVARIEPLRPRIIELGGSRAQRDVFHDTLLEACFRGDRLDLVERRLVDRLARRRDHYWQTRGTRIVGGANGRGQAPP